MATEPKLSPYLHLPVQSGSDRILRRMARDYDTAFYVNLVDRLRAAIPDLALSTDHMVGFPDETESDFASTLDLVRTLRFDHAFMFRYSRRKGTKAYSRGEDVPDDEKTSRLQRLIELQEEIAAQRNLELVGQEVEVLVEGPAKRPAGWQMGRTPQFKVTVFPDSARVGDVIGVRIADATGHTLMAASPA